MPNPNKPTQEEPEKKLKRTEKQRDLWKELQSQGASSESSSVSTQQSSASLGGKEWLEKKLKQYPEGTMDRYFIQFLSDKRNPDFNANLVTMPLGELKVTQLTNLIKTLNVLLSEFTNDFGANKTNSKELDVLREKMAGLALVATGMKNSLKQLPIVGSDDSHKLIRGILKTCLTELPADKRELFIHFIGERSIPVIGERSIPAVDLAEQKSYVTNNAKNFTLEDLQLAEKSLNKFFNANKDSVNSQTFLALDKAQQKQELFSGYVSMAEKAEWLVKAVIPEIANQRKLAQGASQSSNVSEPTEEKRPGPRR